MANTSSTTSSDQQTDLVNFKILLNGNAISGEYRINSLEVNKFFNKISTAKIALADGDPSKQDFEISSGDDALTPGNEIEIQMGYQSQAKTIFKGIITSHSIRSAASKHSVLTIEAKDKAVKLTFGRNNRFFIEKTDSDVMESIAGETGIAKDIDTTSFQHMEMIQFNATNWDFLISRAEMSGMLVLTDDNKLVIKKPDTGQDPVMEITYGVNVLDFDSTLDVRSQLTDVKSYSWNYKDQKAEESADANVTYKECGNLSGNQLAEKMEIKERKMIHSGSLRDEEMAMWGKAKLLKSKMAKACGRIKVKGSSEVKPGHMIMLKGFSKRFNGNVLVTGIRHSYDKSIWETDIFFGLYEDWFYQQDDVIEKPAAGLIPGVNGLQIGVVMQLESDPDGEDRIKIQLPMVDGHDGMWARVACLDAGNERGSFFRPELQDEVIVGFLNDDPRCAIVLGMLNSSAKPAPLKAADANPEKGFVTRSKLKFIFNDEKKIVKIETPSEKMIEINDDSDSITLSDQFQNKIVLNSDGVTIESGKDICLKAATGNIQLEALNIESKANVKFSAQGNASAELQSSGQTVVKGSIVNIN